MAAPRACPQRAGAGTGPSWTGLPRAEYAAWPADSLVRTLLEGS